MSLNVLSDIPISGNSTRAKELKSFYDQKGKKLVLISENEAIPKAGLEKNACHADLQKVGRSDLKSEAFRVLNKKDIVILDAGINIKGYRYELLCATKAARSTEFTFLRGIQEQKAWMLKELRATEKYDGLQAVTDQTTLNNSNVPYTSEIFDALCMRFEEPHGKCRWDSPLFVCFPEDQLDVEAIYSALYESKALPPNMSTQNLPLSSTNFLFELDSLTKEIVFDVLCARQICILWPASTKNCQTQVDVPIKMNTILLNRLRDSFSTTTYCITTHLASWTNRFVINVPDVKYSKVSFRNFKHKLDVPFGVYADFESFLITPENTQNSIRTVQSHIWCAYSYYIKRSSNNSLDKLRICGALINITIYFYVCFFFIST